MGATTRRDLFLQVSASTDNMQAALKAGRSELTRTGAAAVATTDQIQKAFADLGGGNIETTARSIDAAYSRTFANIRANAMKVLDMPTGNAAFQVLNASAAQQAADAATAQASGLRLVADAAAKAADATTGDATAARVYATAAQAAAVGAEEQAAALRAQAGVLAGVRTQLEAAGVAEVELAGSHTRMGASGMIAEHVVRSLSDSIAAGQSPARALGMEMGRITEAMTLFAATTGTTEGFVGKFAGFMGGPWGLAISVGVAVLTPLIGKLIDAGEAAKDAKKGEEEYANYQNDLANFIDVANGKLRERLRLLAEVGLREGAQKVTDQQKQIGNLRQQTFNKANADAPVIRTEFVAERQPSQKIFDPQVQTAISSAGGDPAKLVANLQALAKSRPDLQAYADSVAHIAGQWAFASQNLDKLKGSQKELTTLLAGGTVMSPETAERDVRDRLASTPLEKAQAHLADVQAQGRDLTAAPYDAASWKRYEQDLYTATKAVRDLQKAQRDAKGNEQVGRQIDLSQAEDIVRGIGGRITSAQRSTAEQQVLYDRYKAGTGSLAAKPGTSEHERGQALDVAKAAGITLAALKKAFESQGVHLTEALDEGNHYHVAWGPKGPSADTLARRQRSAVVKDANTDAAFQSQLGEAQRDMMRASLGLSDNPALSGQIERSGDYADLTQKKLGLADQVKAGKISQAQSDQLAEYYATTEELTEIKSLTKERVDTLNKQMEPDQQALADGIALLKLQEDLATTAKQRRDIALRLLAAEEKRATIPLQAIVDRPDLYTPDQVRKARSGINQIADEHTDKVRQIDRQNADPLQAYGQQLQSNVGDMNTALKGVEVDGLKGLEDGLTGILTGTKTVAGAFKQMATSIIADLARIAIEKAILSFLPGFGLKDGGKVGGFADGGLPGFAGGGDPSITGGIIRGAGTGRSDSILALVGGKKPIMVSNGEGIVNERAVQKWWPEIDAMNKGTFEKFATGGLVSPSSIYMRKLPTGASVQRASAGGGQPITFDLRGAVMTQDLLNQMNAISARHAQAAIIGGAHQAAEDRHDDAYSAIPQ